MGLAKGSVFAAGNCAEAADVTKQAMMNVAGKANRMIYTSGKNPTVAIKVGIQIIAHQAGPCSKGQ
jgi:hypothetical protein